MKQYIIFFLAGMLIIFLSLPSCNKNEDDNTPIDTTQLPLEYLSLEIEEDTLPLLATTNVTATATGYQLSYFWSATMGDILGSGKEIQYLAPNCTLGEQVISCKVQDGNGQSETKTVVIFIVPL